MAGHDLSAGVQANYRAFSQVAARGRSRQYEILAAEVAADPSLVAFLATLAPAKRQPNLVFAAAWYLLGHPPDLASLHLLAATRGAELVQVIQSRSTQTNEPGRCASLLPALMQLPQPLALIEVGASAGLTLLPDRYSYDYAGHRVAGTDPQAPVLRCPPRGPVPLPERVPDVCWRAGLDLNPPDLRNDDDVRWLECLLWPGEAGRRQRLAGAIATALRDPPAVFRGDLLTDLPALASRVPSGATLVIYHCAVLGYLSESERRQWAAVVSEVDAVWLSCEPAPLFPDVSVPIHGDSSFLIIRDGRIPLAATDPHGAWLQWLS